MREGGCEGGGEFFFFFKLKLGFGLVRLFVRTIRLIIAANRSRIFINDTLLFSTYAT